MVESSMVTPVVPQADAEVPAGRGLDVLDGHVVRVDVEVARDVQAAEHGPVPCHLHVVARGAAGPAGAAGDLAGDRLEGGATVGDLPPAFQRKVLPVSDGAFYLPFRPGYFGPVLLALASFIARAIWLGYYAPAPGRRFAKAGAVELPGAVRADPLLRKGCTRIRTAR